MSVAKERAWAGSSASCAAVSSCCISFSTSRGPDLAILKRGPFLESRQEKGLESGYSQLQPELQPKAGVSSSWLICCFSSHAICTHMAYQKRERVAPAAALDDEDNEESRANKLARFDGIMAPTRSPLTPSSRLPLLHAFFLSLFQPRVQQPGLRPLARPRRGRSVPQMHSRCSTRPCVKN